DVAEVRPPALVELDYEPVEGRLADLLAGRADQGGDVLLGRRRDVELVPGDVGSQAGAGGSDVEEQHPMLRRHRGQGLGLALADAADEHVYPVRDDEPL